MVCSYKLVYYPNPILRKVCEPVEDFNDDLKYLVSEMIRIMHLNDGIGIAAPQVGSLKSVFIMSTSLPSEEEGNDVQNSSEEHHPIVFINPTILSKGDSYKIFQEGCLSIPSVYANVQRSSEVTLRYYTLMGEECEDTFTGMQAICVQHEVDHLNGKLFIDYLGKMQRFMALEKLRKYMKKRGIE